MQEPYLEIDFRHDTPVETGRFSHRGPVMKLVPGYHAKFAATALIPPFESVEPRKEGFGIKDLKSEAMARQVTALSNLRENEKLDGEAPSLRTISLRASNSSASGALRFCLMGKTFARSMEGAHQHALLFWSRLWAFFSSDYELRPATTYSEYMDWSAQSYLVGSVRTPEELIEVRQKERIIIDPAPSRTVEQAYVLYPFRARLHAMEDIWRGLALWEGMATVSITLRAASFYEGEFRGLAELRKGALQLTKASTFDTRLIAGAAADYYSDLANQLWQPFVIRINVVADHSAHALANAIGTSLTLGEEIPNRLLCGYAVCHPSTPGELQTIQQNLTLLEMDQWGECVPPAPYRRLRELVSPEIAQTAFRLPLPSKGGWPGVTFLS